MKLLKRLSLLLLGVVAAIAVVVAVRTATYSPPGAATTAVTLAPGAPVDPGRAAEHLSEAVRIRTVSHQDRIETTAPSATASRLAADDLPCRARGDEARTRRGSHARLHLAGRGPDAGADRAAGPPRRGAGDAGHRGGLEAPAVRGRDRRRCRLGPRFGGRQGLADRHLRGGRGARGKRVPTAAHGADPERPRRGSRGVGRACGRRILASSGSAPSSRSTRALPSWPTCRCSAAQSRWSALRRKATRRCGSRHRRRAVTPLHRRPRPASKCSPRRCSRSRRGRSRCASADLRPT